MRLHVFSRPFPAQTFVPIGVIEGLLLIILLIKVILTRTRLVVVFAIFGSPDFLKILLLVSRGILYARFFSIDSCMYRF